MTRITATMLASVEGLSSREAALKLGVGKSTINDARRRASEGRLTAFQVAQAVPTSPDNFKVLALDLETAPNLGYFWGLWKQNIGINQLESSTEVICFGARWLGTDEVIFRSSFHHGKEEMIRTVYDLVDEADAIMGWNSKGFDVKHLNREFLLAGLTPPSPAKDMDLMLEVKKVFRFPSNKLDYVAQALGVGAKVTHTGFDLWRRCMAGDPEAWEEMRTYQEQDVNLLIDLYYKLRPWMKGHPHVGLFSGMEFACPFCDSVDLQRRGTATTGVSTFQRFRCSNCGAWSRSAKAELRPALRKAV